MSVLEYKLIARQISGFVQQCLSAGFDPQQALQEAIEQYGERQYGWSSEFAAEVYSFAWDAWNAGQLTTSIVERAIEQADG